MPFSAGTRLGPYEIVTLIGAGGMGEVYRARDTGLNRDVAIKVLPDVFANDAERLARFTREAQTLASLNHPNIAHIHGLEESGGVRALVMELVEGEDLAQRLRRGAIPLEDALPIARQIAEALEAAHEQGIVHRDLKPANIKLRPDGTLKVLDFGLAKALTPETGGATAVQMSQSPTITSPAMLTGVGVILGTAAYMAPEQARGNAADRRSDMWAFGCVVYEMLTGTRAFAGDDLAETLASVLKSEPDWTALPATVPGSIRTLLRQCLTKDRKLRLDSAVAARLEIDDTLTIPAPAVGSVPPKQRRVWRRVAIRTLPALVIGAAAGTMVWFATRPAAPSVVHTTVTTSGSAALSLVNANNRHIVITPDGTRIVYRGVNQLLVRALDQLEPTVLSGLGSPQNLFISPDGQWIGFVDATTFKKVPLTGGLPVTLCDAPGNPRGAAWSTDGTIIFATDAVTTGLQRVSATGGEPTVLTKPDRERGEGDHYWPEFLPGGDAVLFTIIPASGAIENAQIAVLDLQTGTSKVLVHGGSHAQYVATGHLVYGVTGTLRAVGFDLERLEVVGTAAPVLADVLTAGSGVADVAIAGNGSLVYIPGSAENEGQQTIVSVDRQGRASRLPGLPPDSYRDIRVSPDGARLALATLADVWSYDFVRETLSRLTNDLAPDTRPLWTPDGQRIIFTSRRAGYPELFWRNADGTGGDERLLSRATDLIDLRANDWSDDGRLLLFSELLPGVQGGIWQIDIQRPSNATVVLIGDAFAYAYAAVSPNGRWIAYQSGMSGRSEVYVERYPELGSRQQISTSGGRIPLWSRDGRELFFIGPDNRQVLAVPVQSPTLAAGRPQVLFEFAIQTTGGSQPYDIDPDGRFLFIQMGQVEGAAATERSLLLVQNWLEELKRLVPFD